MVTRKKTLIERVLSFNQHKRRFGASKSITRNANFEELKNKIVTSQKFSYTHGSKPDLSQHLKDLRGEFRNKTELEYYHAELNVLLRRNYKRKETFEKFKVLWDQEYKFLLNHLNTRWLISAADSFIDNDPNKLSKAYALSAVCIINSCKIYETERFLCDTDGMHYKEHCIDKLKNERVGLFDGTSAFKIGSCDTLRNMRWRLDSQNSKLPSYFILQEVFKRVNKHDTAYSRLAQNHTNKNTIWF